jgi:Tol biopolymer transport system component
LESEIVKPNTRTGKALRIFASSFLLIIAAIVLIIWLWPNSPPPFTESLKIATPAGVELTQLTSSSVRKQDVAWSPDGKYLAYVKWYDPEIYLIDIGNRTESQLTHWNGWNTGGFGLLEYSDDGSEMFLGTGGGLWAQSIYGGMPQSLIPSVSAPWGNAWVEGYGARFSMDKCAFFAGTYPAELYVIDLDDGNPEMLAGELRDGLYATLDLSPDGTRVVYSAGIIGQSEPGYPNMPLQYMWVINTDGTNQTLISEDPGDNLRWSPDGNKIAFLRDGNLWLINPDGTGEETLTTEGDSICRFEWSPDGNKIAYWSMNSGQYSCNSLWTMDMASHSQECVLDLNDTNVYVKSWRGFAWSPDSRSMAFILAMTWQSDLSSVSEEQQVFMLTLNNSDGS